MADITYPAALPIMQIRGLTSQYKDPVIRTEMDAGPVKQRLRYTAAPKQFTGVITLTEDQRALFDSWFVHDLGYGTLRFNMTNPQTLAVEEFRFTGPPGESESDGYWELSLPVERLA